MQVSKIIGSVSLASVLASLPNVTSRRIVTKLRWFVSLWVLLLAASLVTTAGCNGAAAHSLSNTSENLDRFSDWRVAYANGKDHLTITSLTGQSIVGGSVLPGLALDGLVVSSAGAAPNGHLVAYSSVDGLHVIDVTGHLDGSHVPHITAQEVVWSPDSMQLALGDGQGHIGIVNVVNGRYAHIPSTTQVGLASIIGWVDNGHLAVTLTHSPDAYQAQGDSSVSVGILDVSTWNVRTLTKLSVPGMGVPRFAISPDGKHLLFYNKEIGSASYTPRVEEVDLASGAVTAMPQITAAMGSYSGFTSIAWRADEHTIAASSGFAENHDLKTWLLDLTHDTATPIHLPDAMYVIGWMPDNGPLVLSSGWDSIANRGPYEISAARVDQNGSAALTVLAHDAMTFPCIGFVRTA